MGDTELFIDLARQHGYRAERAEATLTWARDQLAAHGVRSDRFCIFRTSGGVRGADGASTTRARTRLLLAFSSADAALVFAQHAGLGAAPRLANMSLAQLLAVLVQRQAIGALHIALDGDDGPETAGLPAGLRIERDALIDSLRGVTL